MKPQITQSQTKTNPKYSIKTSQEFNTHKSLKSQETFFPKINQNKQGPSRTLDKKKRGFGQTCDNEELYENTVLLKKRINKLKLELAEAKSNYQKTEVNLRNNERLIEDLSKQNEESKNDSNNKQNYSSVATKIDKSYKALQKGYKSLQNKNNDLKADVKSTKMREAEIEYQIISEELNKIKSLYNNSQELNSSYNAKKEELKEFKNKIKLQNKIIDQYEKDNIENDEEIKRLTETLEKMKNKLKKTNQTIQKQQELYEKLEKDKEVFLEEQKKNEKYEISYPEYQERVKNLKRDITIIKNQYKKKVNEFNDLQKTCKANNIELRPAIQMNSDQMISAAGRDKSNVDSKKAEFLNSMTKELTLKCKIYEQHIRNKNEDPDQILEDANYDGILGKKSDHPKKEDANLKEEEKKESEEDKQKEEETPEQIYEYMLIKNIEATKQEKEKLIEDLKKINFEKENPEPEMIIDKYSDFLINIIISKNEKNKEILSSKIKDTLNSLKSDKKALEDYFIKLIEQIKSYKNEEDLTKNLKNYLYLNSIALQRKKAENNILAYEEFKNLFEGIYTNLDKDQFDYLIYLLKTKTDEKEVIENINIDWLVTTVTELNGNEKLLDKLKVIKNISEKEKQMSYTQIFKGDEVSFEQFFKFLEDNIIHFDDDEDDKAVKEALTSLFKVKDKNDLLDLNALEIKLKDIDKKEENTGDKKEEIANDKKEEDAGDKNEEILIEKNNEVTDDKKEEDSGFDKQLENAVKEDEKESEKNKVNEEEKENAKEEDRENDNAKEEEKENINEEDRENDNAKEEEKNNANEEDRENENEEDREKDNANEDDKIEQKD